MRIGGLRKYNCTLSAPQYGSFDVVATTLGYGFNVAASEGSAKTKRTFYPFVRTSGMWYIESVHGNRAERDELNKWLLQYIRQASNPWSDRPLAPITVTVPSRNFIKTGYPTGSIDFGDSAQSSSWNVILQFTSASDPTTSSLRGSRFTSAASDATAKHFYPGERQDNSSVPPVDQPVFATPDEYWNDRGFNPVIGGSGGGGNVR